jgi:membrane associated rhomboid family serine protease
VSQGHRPLPRVLSIGVGLIALIEVVLSLADAGFIGDPTLRMRLFEAGAFWTGLLHGATARFAAQPATMFVSHALLHGGLLHMVMNLTILLALGRFVADRYGAGVILPLFLAGAVAGGAAFGLLSSGGYPMVGASGAVFGFLGVWIAWDWKRHRDHGLPVAPVLRRVAVLAGLNLLLYIGLGGMVAWEAHLGGFAIGVAVGAWLEGRIAARDRERRAEVRRRRGEAGGKP